MSVYDEKYNWIDDISRTIAKVMKASSRYKLVSDAHAERFGGADVAMWRRDDEMELDRFVIVSVVPYDIEGYDDPTCMVEIAAGAENGTRYTRQLVARRNVAGVGLVNEFVGRMMEVAIDRAEALAPDDLDERRIGGAIVPTTSTINIILGPPDDTRE